MADQEDDNDIWCLEERLWVEGAETWARLFHPDCVIAMPDPAGVLAGEAVAASLVTMPRWSSVHIMGQAAGRIDAGLVVLAYVGEGRRPEAPVYRALCTSTWRGDEGGWKLVQHQQTPLGPREVQTR